MCIEEFLKGWIAERPRLSRSFHRSTIEAMTFAEDYHRARLDEKYKTKCPVCSNVMEGFILTHYRCNHCKEMFTD